MNDREIQALLSRCPRPEHNTTEDLNDLEQFEKACQNFDWFYDFSDDHRVWRAGNQRSKVLDRAKNISAEHERIFNKYQKIAHDRIGRA